MSIIAISRGTFSGGEALAKRVAEQLGYRCLSRETILEEAAKACGVPAKDLVGAMEKQPAFWQRVLGERAAHLTFVRAALCAQARADTLVFHGHVGHLLLPRISHVIRVRVFADLDLPYQGGAGAARAGGPRRRWRTSTRWTRSGGNGCGSSWASNEMTRTPTMSS
jgi:Cytidylate kinase-like family